MEALKNIGCIMDCIMLVDDDAVYNFLHEKLIKTIGYNNHIEIALNGKDALDYIINVSEGSKQSNLPLPNLILLDINMPIMNGWQFLEGFKKLDEKITKNITIVMVTSSIDPDDITKAETDSYIQGFVSKPLTQEKFEDLLKKFSMRVA
jgi:CheY-like chemotaxis protein